MNTQHTPGPWKIIRSSDYTGDEEDSDIQSIVGANDATVFFTDSGYFKPLEQDARLIAAAPELLEALKAVLQDWRADLMMRGCSMSEAEEMMGCREGYDLARAAIAKAEGRE